jgi:hypothetical protein
MTHREKNLLLVIGGFASVWILYQAANFLLFSPMRSAEQEIARLTEEHDRLVRERERLPSLARQWKEHVSRTYSQDERETQNAFGEELRRLADRHGLRGARFQPRRGGTLRKTDVRTLSFLVVAEGKLNDVIGFLHDFYQLPTLGRIRKLNLAPVRQMGGSDEIKIVELAVETLVLPRFDSVPLVEKSVAGLSTLPSDSSERLPTWRRHVLEEASLAELLRERNIFKAYEPPPDFKIAVDNKDRKTVEVTAVFYWKDEVLGQPSATVTGNTKMTLPTGQGDVVELKARYADGKEFGPQRLTYQGAREVVFTVPSHTPPPPPDTFVYKVKNEHDEPVEVLVTIVRKGKSQTFPRMLVTAKQTVDLPELGGDTLRISAMYPDKTPVQEQVYEVARASSGVYVVPPMGKEPVRQPPVQLPPPDPNLQVTGLWTYPEAQEMIAYDLRTKQRKILTRGSDIDGGKLIAVHPLGGVVRMPGGVFYLYPLGRKFTERVALSAESETEVASAIDAWNRQ